MVPEAPSRVTTTNCWPSSTDIEATRLRAMTSTLPPAGNATITCTGRAGYAGCARAEAIAAKSTAARASSRASFMMAASPVKPRLILALLPACANRGGLHERTPALSEGDDRTGRRRSSTARYRRIHHQGDIQPRGQARREGQRSPVPAHRGWTLADGPHLPAAGRGAVPGPARPARRRLEQQGPLRQRADGPRGRGERRAGGGDRPDAGAGSAVA